MTALNTHLTKLLDGHNLTREESAYAFQIMMNGGATPAMMAALMVALRMKGESVDEITGAALAMRTKMTKIRAPEGTIDTCGTGGDHSGSFNISTAVALVVAGCGVPVAKHGNRSVSSRSGSADVLKSLGVNLDAGERYVERALAEAHICFMMAPRFHAAMRHIAPVRAELGVRTVFNLLGPLSNPAGAKRQLIGVYDKKWLLPLAEVLRELGTDKAWLVHGVDGMDEVTTAAITHVVELKDGNITSFDIHPESLGIAPPKTDALKGGDAHFNARALTGLLSGDAGAYRDIVLLNAAAALMVADKAATLEEGMALATQSIDSRKAKEALAQLVMITNEDTSVTEATAR